MLGFSTEFLVVSLVLGCLGGVLKHRFNNLPNALIPSILFVMSVLICGTWGYYLTYRTGTARIVEAVVVYGIFQGFIAAAISTEVWDMFHGLYKVYIKDRIQKISHALQGGQE